MMVQGSRGVCKCRSMCVSLAFQSAPSWPNGKNGSGVSSRLDVDGLITWINPAQSRLAQVRICT